MHCICLQRHSVELTPPSPREESDSQPSLPQYATDSTPFHIPHFFPFVFKMEATSIYQIHQEMQDSEWRIAISNGKQNADVPFPFPQACFLVYWICFSLFFVPCGGIDWFLQQWYGRVRWSENIRVKKRYTADAIENMWPKTLNALLWKLFFLSLTSY